MAKKFYYHEKSGGGVYREIFMVWWHKNGTEVAGLSLDEDNNWYIARFSLGKLARNITVDKLVEKIMDTTHGWSCGYGKDWKILLEDNPDIISDLHEMHNEILKMV